MKNITLLFQSLLVLPKYPIHVSDSFFSAKRHSRLHDHDFYEFFIVRAGKLKHTCNGRVSVLSVGEICFVTPADVHILCSANDRQTAVISNVAFTSGLFHEVVRQLPSINMAQVLRNFQWCKPHETIYRVLMHKIDLLRAALVSQSETALMLLQSLLLDLCIALGDRAYGTTVTVPYWLDQACIEMKKRENFSQGLNKFITLCGKSQEHVTRTMQALYKTRPSAFISNLRTDEAARQLAITDAPITQILFDVGYKNISYFNNQFKARFGVSPREYRKRMGTVFG